MTKGTRRLTFCQNSMQSAPFSEQSVPPFSVFVGRLGLHKTHSTLSTFCAFPAKIVVEIVKLYIDV